MIINSSVPTKIKCFYLQTECFVSDQKRHFGEHVHVEPEYHPHLQAALWVLLHHHQRQQRAGKRSISIHQVPPLRPRLVSETGFLWTPIHYSSLSIVIPAEPENLIEHNVTAHSLNLTWAIPFPLQNFPPGLIHRVEYRHKWLPEDHWIVSFQTIL